MNKDELLEKYLKGDIDAEAFDNGYDSLSEEDRGALDVKLSEPEVRKQISAKSREELTKISALRKEGKRLEDKNKPPEQRPADETHPADDKSNYAATLRKENLETAFDGFFKEFGVPAEEREHYRDIFKQNDDGSVSVERIKTVLKRIYATEHSDELLAIRDRHEALVSGAEEFSADHAGAPGGAGPGGGDEEKYSPEVMNWVKESRKQGVMISPDAAKKVLERGFTRKIG